MKTNQLIAVVFFLFPSIAANLAVTPTLEAQGEPFYKGKTVRIVVGFTPGGGFDVWARAIAQHISRHIPGNPQFVVQNMPGAGSMTAANYVYNVAKPDGLTIGTFTPTLYIEQLLEQKEVQYDWAKFSWIGQPERRERIFYMRSDTPYKSLEDIRKAPEAPRCGATGQRTLARLFPMLLDDAVGLKLNIVPGYQGAADVNIAIERGEVHCWAGTVGSFFISEPSRTWAKTGFVRVLIQGGRKRDPRLPDVPTIWELMDRRRTPESTRRLVGVLLASDELGHPYVGSPGIPVDRVKILRDAFVKTMNSSELLAEAVKRDWIVNPTWGDELEGMARELIGQPPQVIEEVKKFLAR
jgi:tripartite-type tricarboxylate transporter receptor subunit TctC